MINKILNKDLSSLVYSCFFGYLLILAFICLFKINYLTENVPPPISEVPDFEFYDNNGKIITKDSLINKIIILDFIFTRCEGTCPIMFDFMHELYLEYKNTSEVVLLSLTVDPEYDTKEILKLYAQANGVFNDQWHFLTGEMDQIKSFTTKGFNLISDFFPSTHTKNFYLIDREGKYRKFYDGTNKNSINQLKKHIKILLKEAS